MTTDHALSRYPVPSLDALPPDIRQRIDDVHAKSGFIPNVFLVLAHRPEEFRAFFAYYDALMLRDSGLSKAEREMIVVATSAANDCHRRSGRGELSPRRYHPTAARHARFCREDGRAVARDRRRRFCLSARAWF